MQITALQMNALDGGMYERFVRQLVAFIRSECDTPDALDPALIPRDDATLAANVRALLGRAQALGICTERGLAAFGVLGCTYSADFDSIPGARQILRDPFKAPEDRILEVMEIVERAVAQRGTGGRSS